MKSKVVVRITLMLLCFLGLSISAFAQKPNVKKSTELVNAVRYGHDASKLLEDLATVDPETLANELSDDQARKTFWINVYNAHIQMFLTENPNLFDDRPSFFKTPRVEIAGEMLSFDEIEHGILRRSKAKWGLGIFPKLFPPKFERMFRVEETDPRIHFALNCGASSCPPVAAYDYGQLDEQLEDSTRRLLKKTTKYHPEKNEVEVIALFSWFRGDWGCKSDVRKFLKKYDVIPQDAKPSINYASYDWTLETGNYIDL